MTRQLARPDWEGFFQRFTRRYLATADDRPQTATVEVMEDDEGFLSTLEVLHDDGSKEIIYMRRSGPLARLLTGPPASP